MIDISLFWTWSDGYGIRESNISMFILEDEDDISKTKSLGCFPLIISNANTPKLYTSHFSVTFIV